MAELQEVADIFWSIKPVKERKKWLKNIRAAIDQMDVELASIQHVLMADYKGELSPPEQLFETDITKMSSHLALETVVNEFKVCVERMRQLQLAFGIDDAEDDCDEMDTSDDDKMDDADDADDMKEEKEDAAVATTRALNAATSPSSALADLHAQLARLKLQHTQQAGERDDALQHCTQIIQRLEDEAAGLQRELLLRIRELQQVVRERDALKKANAEKPLW
ncbi:hypothetical protein IWZ00DRAFT_545699 [Phyllosticta capitalensis]